MKSTKKFLLLAILLLVVGVVLGAFGAHILKDKLANESLLSFETAVKYQFYGSFSVLFFIVLSELKSINYHRGLSFLLAGTILFSFSIYGLLLFKYFALPYLIFVPLTPLGGLFLIVGLSLIFLKTLKEWPQGK